MLTQWAQLEDFLQILQDGSYISFKFLVILKECTQTFISHQISDLTSILFHCIIYVEVVLKLWITKTTTCVTKTTTCELQRNNINIYFLGVKGTKCNLITHELLSSVLSSCQTKSVYTIQADRWRTFYSGLVAFAIFPPHSLTCSEM